MIGQQRGESVSPEREDRKPLLPKPGPEEVKRTGTEMDRQGYMERGPLHFLL